VSVFSIKSLRGVLLPFPTPFDNDSGLDQRALRSNIERWNASGVAGYVPLGSTGERVHLGDDEYQKLIEVTRARVPNNLAFIPGAGQQSVRATIDEARIAARLGADALLVITPNFYKSEMTQNALVNYYMAVADASHVPLLLYSVPHLTGVTIQPETIARLSEHENIVGVKDSSGDILALAETIRLVSNDFVVLTGNGSGLYPALCMGARGGILAIGCIAPRLAVAIYDAFQSGEHERARTLQQQLTRLTRAILVRYGISGLKAALDMLGYTGGRVRAPLSDSSEEARREIAAVLKETEMMNESGVESLESGVKS